MTVQELIWELLGEDQCAEVIRPTYTPPPGAPDASSFSVVVTHVEASGDKVIVA